MFTRARRHWLLGGPGVARAIVIAITVTLAPSLLAFPQQEQVATFGTTVVVPGGLVGVIYYIPPWTTSFPFFQTLGSVGIIYTSSLNVPPRNFMEGFPGITDRYEWFAIDYGGRFWIEKPGTYQFALTSDDGSKLFIDDEVVIDNDGIHPPQTRTNRIALSGGVHRIRVCYFQGPGDKVALILQVASLGGQWRIFSTDEFKPPPNPEAWHFGDSDQSGVSTFDRSELRVAPRVASPGQQVSADFVLQSPAGSEIIGLKWNVIVPAQVLDLIGGGARADAAKSVEGELARCTMEKIYRYVCTLAAQEKPIANGSIATFDFNIHSDAKAQTVTVRVENIEATTKDGRRTALTDAEGSIIIH